MRLAMEDTGGALHCRAERAGDNGAPTFWRFGVLILAMVCTPVGAVDVGLAGVFPGKALLTIDGTAPRAVAVGTTTVEGVKVLSVDSDVATVEADGKKRILRVGQKVVSKPAEMLGSKAVLTADARGHFVTTGAINGTTVRFLVDTGATMITVGASDARRLGIGSKQGQMGVIITANGPALVRHVRLDSVRVGEIVVDNVDAMINIDNNLPFVLLGMNFLNYLDIQGDGQTMSLRKR